MSHENNVPWVVMGGKIGEICYCTRCGRGLLLQSPVLISDFTKSLDSFVETHASCLERHVPESEIKTPADWIGSRWTGVSSATIWTVMTGIPSPYNRYDIPYDPSDFGRCYKLLEMFPFWRSRLEEVSKRFPFWAPFVRDWDELTALYRQAIETKRSTSLELYERLKTLVAEASPLMPRKS